jgi:uncharacterized protein involved in exopolysaccharide biosynthesis
MEIHRAKTLGFALLLAGLALGGAGLWLLLSPAQYRATARIKAYEDGVEIENYWDKYPQKRPAAVYDPYVPAAVTENLRSDAVLGKVVTNLNLYLEWSQEHGGDIPLSAKDTINRLRCCVKIRLASLHHYFEIDATGRNPAEAAKIANAIAEAYREFRFEQWRQVTIHGIRVLTEQYQKDAEQIHAVQTNVERLRVECKITNDVPPPQLQPEHNAALPGQPYWEEKRKLETMLDFHKLLAAKIEASKLDLNIPRTSPVEIVDPATPSKSPIVPNRLLGTLLLATGFFLSVGGFLLLKPSRRPSG